MKEKERFFAIMDLCQKRNYGPDIIVETIDRQFQDINFFTTTWWFILWAWADAKKTVNKERKNVNISM